MNVHSRNVSRKHEQQRADDKSRGGTRLSNKSKLAGYEKATDVPGWNLDDRSPQLFSVHFDGLVIMQIRGNSAAGRDSLINNN